MSYNTSHIEQLISNSYINIITHNKHANGRKVYHALVPILAHVQGQPGNLVACIVGLV